MRPRTSLCLVLVVVLAGCGGAPTTTPSPESPQQTTQPTATAEPTTATPTDEPTATPTDEPTPTATPEPENPYAAHPDDPPTDVIGWENGRWHNESLEWVEDGDGLNESEFAAVKNRTMARVEVIRQAEYERDTEFEFITREELGERVSFEYEYDPARNQYWEAAFTVGEDRTAAEVRTEMLNAIVSGLPSVLVVENPGSPMVDRTTLAHELSHVLVGTRINSGSTGHGPGTRDDFHAQLAMEEGTAEWVERRYQQLCGEKWDCIRMPEKTGDVDSEAVNMGMYVKFLAKYVLGEQFLAHRYEQGGIEAVKDARAVPPSSTEQLIHPEKYGSEFPTKVSVEERTAGNWSQTGDTMFDYNFGEAGLWTMLWYNGLVEGGPVYLNDSDRTELNYTHPAVAGWAGDVVIPYTNGSASGYVFKSVWDTAEDAREFHEAYLELLESNDAEQVGPNTYVVESGPFADAFRVVRQNDTLVVVNAPTVAALDDVHDVNETSLVADRPASGQSMHAGFDNVVGDDAVEAGAVEADGTTRASLVVPPRERA